MYLSARTITSSFRGRSTSDDDAGPDDRSAVVADAAPGGNLPPEPENRTGAEHNVVLLGLTSMFTDISSEMIGSVLPLYLTLLFGLTPWQFGLFDGAYQSLGALVALAVAVFADRRRRLKASAGIGYGLSTVCALGLAAANGMWLATIGTLYADRLGKGIRTAPRDALLSVSVTRDRLGRAFGLHRAFDTVGAIVGPVVASLVLARTAAGAASSADYQRIFVLAFFASVVGLTFFVLFVDGRREVGPPAGAAVPPRVRRDLATLVRHRPFVLCVLLGSGFGFLAPGDGLVYLSFLRDSSIGAASFPLLYSGSSVVFLLASYPVGRLADRLGRLRVFLAGEVLMAGVFVVLAAGGRSIGALVLLLGLLGAQYAATAGVLMAATAATLPVRLRAAGLATLVTALAASRFVASASYGWLWSTLGVPGASWMFAGVIGAGVVAAALWIDTSPGPARTRTTA